METKVEVANEVKEKIHEKLSRLGLGTAATKVKELAERKRKMMLAYEHYRFVRPEKIKAFNDKLKKSTMKRDAYGYERFDQLSLTPLGHYSEVPPPEILTSLEIAIERKCFDSYEVAHIVKEVKVPDPILFGCIAGCADRFIIGQWDDDVKIEDLLAKNEG